MRIIFSNPFETEGSWFKGNLHTHSVYSDGQMTVEQLAKLYKTAGYDFLSITDHGVFTDVDSFSERGFLMLPGEEISVGSSGNGRFTHVVGIAIEEELPLKDFDSSTSPQEAIDAIRNSNGTAIIAHPYWSDLTYDDLRELHGHLGLEVYNSTCELMIGRGYSNVHWDELLSRSHKTLGFAVDDAHCFTRPFLPLDLTRAFIQVKSTELTAESLLESIKLGLFYSSTGPIIYGIAIDDNEILVSSSPARSISFISDRAYGRNDSVEKGIIEESKYIVQEEENYVRVEITDWNGGKAWSNPIYVE